MAAKKKDVKDEEAEFREFVLKNEERIMKFLEEMRSEAEVKAECSSEKGKDLVKGIMGAMTDREVQEHFTSMFKELFLGIGSFMKALPYPDEVKPFVDAVSEQRSKISDILCKNNPNCCASSEKKDESIERIKVK